MPPTIGECENDPGSGSALFEAVGCYAQFLHNALGEVRQSRFSCILMIDLDEASRSAIASSLNAFKKAVEWIERYYESLPRSLVLEIDHFSPYRPLSGVALSGGKRELVKSKMRNIVQTLHDNNTVHGDTREVSTLVDPETLAIHLLDFDWAGTYQEVRYPGGVNTNTIERPDGVSDGELITKDHDKAMVRRFFRVRMRYFHFVSLEHRAVQYILGNTRGSESGLILIIETLTGKIGVA
ncbi:uncharacterized protein EI90DRAFT_3010815 [Cantharellus anzutake]|uniref:uncharacterized protein n=1 Tax=Cantharellus anzutake TaxID=1750568 RepID=UPI001908D8D5|nr:uncharacterized protein EI90DRAFT_3010815 [Cantharellus anzutake]KAF8343985.1 hypothetical protein EI90DRAFT_3010815 [Cantharellus anzutake]